MIGSALSSMVKKKGINVEAKFFFQDDDFDSSHILLHIWIRQFSSKEERVNHLIDDGISKTIKITPTKYIYFWHVLSVVPNGTSVISSLVNLQFVTTYLFYFYFSV